jgi:hypothetical protein
MRPALPALCLSALFLAAPARAEESCGPLKILDIVHMLPSLSGDAEIVPIAIAGKPSGPF